MRLHSLVIVMMLWIVPLAADAGSDPFFGENGEMRKIIEEGLQIKSHMQAEKARYLDAYESSMRRNGLSAVLGAERALGQKRNGFATGLRWSLFDGGYFGSREDARRKRLQEEIAYNREIEGVVSAYTKIAALEIGSIRHTIAYHYSGMKRPILKRLLRQAKRKLHSGIITRATYRQIKALYDKNEKALHYLKFHQGKKFDQKYRKLIEKIETVKLLPLDRITERAVAHAVSVENARAKLQLADDPEGIADHIKTTLYLDRKQYTFVDRRETLAGVGVAIPLDTFSKSDELRSVTKQHLKIEARSAELLLRKEIAARYDDIAWHKDLIAKYKRQIALYRGDISQLQARDRYAIAAAYGDSQIDTAMTKLKLLEERQHIWEERCEILINLIRLQYLSGIKIM